MIDAQARTMRIKKFTAWVCAPPLGTVVLNKFFDRHVKAIEAMGGRTVFLPKDLKKLDEKRRTALQGIGLTVTVKDRFLVLGTCGEYLLFSLDAMKKTFTLADGSPFNIVPELYCSTYQDGVVIGGSDTKVTEGYSIQTGMTPEKSLEFVTSYFERYSMDGFGSGESFRLIEDSVAGWMKVTAIPAQVTVRPGSQEEKDEFFNRVNSLGSTGGDYILFSEDGYLGMLGGPAGHIVRERQLLAMTDNRGRRAAGGQQVSSEIKPPELFKVGEGKSVFGMRPMLRRLRDELLNQVMRGGAVNLSREDGNVLDASRWKMKIGDDSLEVGYKHETKTVTDEFGDYEKGLPSYAVRFRAKDGMLNVTIGEMARLYEMRLNGIDLHMDLETFALLALQVSLLNRKNFASSFRSVPVNRNIIEVLRLFVGAGYEDMNKAMRDGDLGDIATFCKCDVLYQYLKSSFGYGQFIFRGGHSQVKAGDTLEYPSFSSWSLSIHAAKTFAGKHGNIYMTYMPQPIEGYYVNTLSDFRDKEFEFVMNAGYRMKVIGKIGEYGQSPIWYVGIEKMEENPFETKYSEVLKKAKLYERVHETFMKFVDLQQRMYEVALSSDKVEYRFFAVPDASVQIRFQYKEERVQCEVSCGEFRKRALLTEEEFLGKWLHTALSYGEKVAMNGHKETPLSDVKLHDYGVNFVFALVSTFSNEGFQILRQEFEDESKGVFFGKVMINGDDDDHVTLLIRVEGDGRLRVRAKTLGKKFDKTYKAERNTALSVVTDMMNEFRLNPFKRITKGIELYARFSRQTVEDEGVGYVTVSGKRFDFKAVGRDIEISCGGKAETIDYYSEIQKIAEVANRLA